MGPGVCVSIAHDVIERRTCVSIAHDGIERMLQQTYDNLPQQDRVWIRFIGYAGRVLHGLVLEVGVGCPWPYEAPGLAVQ